MDLRFKGDRPRGGEHGNLRIRLGMSDEDVVRRFHRLFGFGSVGVNPARGKGTKTMYVWVAYGENAYFALTQMMPWFGERRLARAQELIEIWRP